MSADLRITGDISRERINHIMHMHRSNSFATLLGIEIVEIGEGFCRLRQAVDDKCANPYGGVHGGVTATITDIAMGIAIRTIGLQPITVELTINYLGPSPIGGQLMAEGRVIHRGSRLLITEGTVLTDNGKIVANGRGLFMSREFVERGCVV